MKYFETFVRKEETKASLAEAALMIASEEYPSLDVKLYLTMLKEWGRDLKKSAGASEKTKIEALNDLLFGRMQFTGNVEDYYDPKNSFLNDVMDRRKGIPISLSVIYLELAWQIGLNAAGIGFPGHFLVRVMEEQQPLYIDTFHKGKILSQENCKEFLEDLTEGELPFQDSFLSPMNKRQILVRMLRNLKGIYVEQQNYGKLVKVIDKLIILQPEVAEEVRDRGIIYYQMEAFRLALKDFETFLSMAPDSEDAPIIQQYLEILREYSSRLN